MRRLACLDRLSARAWTYRSSSFFVPNFPQNFPLSIGKEITFETNVVATGGGTSREKKRSPPGGKQQRGKKGGGGEEEEEEEETMTTTAAAASSLNRSTFHRSRLCLENNNGRRKAARKCPTTLTQTNYSGKKDVGVRCLYSRDDETGDASKREGKQQQREVDESNAVPVFTETKSSSSSGEIKLPDAARWLGWTVMDARTKMNVGRVVQILATSGGEVEVEVEGETDSGDTLRFLEALSGMTASAEQNSGGDDDDGGNVAADDIAAYTLLVHKDKEGSEEDGSEEDDDVDDESNFQYIPFAPTMFPKMIPEDKILFIDPPAGLLKGRLGQGDAFGVEGDSLDDSELKEALDKLKFDLMPYARTLGDNHYGMPSKRALEKENRKDLIKRVEKLFGYDWLTMAVLLDFEPFRKPFYYWDNIENLADELRSLVFALWFEQDDVSVSGSGEDDDGGYRTFWYNDISGAILFEKPNEDDHDRHMVMPTRRDLIDARRWDLHHAVVLHGGYGAVAKTLKWPRARWAEDRHLLNFDIFSKELLDCMENELFDDEDSEEEIGEESDKSTKKKKIDANTRLPSALELRNIGRDDLARHMVEHGGPVTVAKRMHMKPGKGAWIRARRENDVNSFKKYLKALAEDVRTFAKEQRKSQKDVLYMPTDEELVNAGRHDLRYRVKEIGSATVAKYAKLHNRMDKMSFDEARAFLHEETLQAKYFRDGKRVEFVHFVKEETGKLMPWNMPRDPMRFYRQREEWVSWKHFLKPIEDVETKAENR